MSRSEPAPSPAGTRYDAVVLAGGAARRLGGADKPGALVGGRSLIAWVAAAAAGAQRLVIVGPARPELPHALVVREDPPGGGPVPALRAGMAAVRAPWTALLAADLPFLRPADLTGLFEAARGHAGAVLTDTGGRRQWLAGVWHSDTLRTALRDHEGSSLRGLLGPLEPALVAPARVESPAHATGEPTGELTGELTGGPVGEPAGEPPPWFDCDTPADLERAGRLGSTGPTAGPTAGRTTGDLGSGTTGRSAR
jgi:molybdopterin-guanine dinucleotide biosynthesis protein A